MAQGAWHLTFFGREELQFVEETPALNSQSKKKTGGRNL